jgi:hypothetical protein
MRKSDWLTLMSNDIALVLDAMDRLNARVVEYNAGGYGGNFSEDDSAGHPPIAGYPDAINSINALEGVLQAGHRTNLLKVRS